MRVGVPYISTWGAWVRCRGGFLCVTNRMPDAGEGNLTSLVLNQRPKAVLWDHHLSRNHFGFGVLPNHGRIIAHTET